MAPSYVPLSRAEVKSVFGGVGKGCDLWEDFDYDELMENMRQKGDKSAVDLLDRVRIGSPTESDIEKLREQEIYGASGIKSSEDGALFFNQHFGDQNVMCVVPKNDEAKVSF